MVKKVSKMISKIIHDYLQHEKRITIPGFGSFIRKENGQIIFMEILRSDDGVLSSLVRKHGDYTEVEAAAVIDRFIFEIRHALQTKGSIRIKGLGTMHTEEGGKIAFTSELDSHATAVPEKKAPVQRISPQPQPRAQVSKKPVAPRKNIQHKKTATAKRSSTLNKKRMDTLLIVAILMAIIALAVMIYGFSVNAGPEFSLIP